MAEKLCTLRTKGGGGGGKQTETVLWTNSAPTTAISTATTIQLSDSITNYDYIKISARLSTSDSSEISYLITPSELQKSVSPKYLEMCVAGVGSNKEYARRIRYGSDTTIMVQVCWEIGSTSRGDSMLIPTSIIGIKNMGGWRSGLKYASGTLTANADNTISVPSTPKRIYVYSLAQGDFNVAIYNEDISTTTIENYYRSSNTGSHSTLAIPNQYSGTIQEVTSSGFKVNTRSNSTNWRYDVYY